MKIVLPQSAPRHHAWRSSAAGLAFMLVIVMLLLPLVAMAQTVAMAGAMGSRAVLVVDGRASVVSEGSVVDGLRVRRVDATQIEIEAAGGQRRVVTLGGTQVSVGPAPAAPATTVPHLVLNAASDHLYRVQAQLNGHAVSAVVDTGASLVSMSLRQAERLGVDLTQAPRTTVQTANGQVSGWRITLDRVQLGSLEAGRVEAVVFDTDLPYVLLGGSFLRRFHMQWRDGQLLLARS